MDELDLQDKISRAAKEFKVSRYVVLRRLLVAELISHTQFSRLMERWRRVDRSARQRRGGPVPQAAQAINRLGPRFVSTVLEAHGRNLISTSDLSSFLSLKVKHLPQVEQLLAAESRG